MALIDLRSDTVCNPSDEMRAAMCSAPVGDDVFGNDPTVNRLQDMAAEMAGKEAGLYLASGTQSNLAGILAHCGRGDEYIVGQLAHTYKYEGGGAAVLGSVQPQPLPHQADGTLDLEMVEAYVKPDDVHHARSRLLCLENTWMGHVMPQDYPKAARALVDRLGLALHLDGARIWNAMVAQGESLGQILAEFDTASICLSKGLGAPVGSVLLGSRDFIKEAHRWRKVLGGGMRQAGILAAAGIYALENNIDRLAEDHAHASRLAEGLRAIDGVDVEPVETNMLFAHMPGLDQEHLLQYMKERNILLLNTKPTLRIVMHLDVSAEDVETALKAFQTYFHAHPLAS